MTRYAITGGFFDFGAEVFDHLDRAVEHLDSIPPDPSIRVCALEELPESALWNWGIHPDGCSGDLLTYVNESAARNCLRDGDVLVKRRKGGRHWEKA